MLFTSFNAFINCGRLSLIPSLLCPFSFFKIEVTVNVKHCTISCIVEQVLTQNIAKKLHALCITIYKILSSSEYKRTDDHLLICLSP